MSTFYAASSGIKQLGDFDQVAEAIAAVEEEGEGRIVKFITEPNAPYCLPKEVARSVATWSYRDKQWRAEAIHGYDNASWPERPDEVNA